MDNETTDAPEVLETQEKAEESTESNETEDSTEDIVELKRKAALADDLEKKNKQLYERAKKAESSSKTKDSGLGTNDILYLAKADIAPDDVDEVITYANKMGVTISEAHKFYKPILDVRAEERRTSDATQTRGARGTAKQTGEDLLQRAERGTETPTTDEGIRALAEARQARRTALKQR
jgi:hypothetical protein